MMTREEARAKMAQIVDGEMDSQAIGFFLLGLRERGETAEEIVGFTDELRSRVIPVPFHGQDAIDVCGTGGDGLSTFNVSTVASFVIASAGVTVAKHGNRSVSSRSGSFDLLEAVGIPLEVDPALAADLLRSNHLAFLFAPSFLPALRRLAPIRKSLGVATVFNFLGPLLNPVRLSHQLIGVSRPFLLETLPLVLRSQGVREAMVVQGEDGLDELTLSGPTRIAHLRGQEIETYRVTPEDFGLERAPIQAVQGGDGRENARILLAILRGEAGPRRDLVVLNSAAALKVSGRAPGFLEAARLAESLLDSGAALEAFRRAGGKEE